MNENNFEHIIGNLFKIVFIFVLLTRICAYFDIKFAYLRKTLKNVYK